jgi:hypothetical protein
MVKCFALVTEVALSSMGLDWVGCSKGVRFSMVWIWLVFQGLDLFRDVGFWWVFSGLGLFKDLDQDVLGFWLFKRSGSFCFVDNTKIVNVFA